MKKEQLTQRQAFIRIGVMLLTLILCFCIHRRAGAETSMDGLSYGDLMARRAGRGIANVAFAPLDVVNTMEDVRFKEGIISGLTYGTIKGLGIATGRLMYGLYEVSTFFYYPEYYNQYTYDVHYDSALFRV